MFSLDLAWLERRGNVEAHVPTTLVYLEGETDTNSNWLLCLVYRILIDTHTGVHTVLLTSQSKVSREYE